MGPPCASPLTHLTLARPPTGIPRTIENTREWLGDEDGEDADPRTRPAPVTVDDQTGDVNVDMGSLSNLFPMAPPPQPTPSGFLPPDAKVLITTSPGKPPAPFTKQFLDDLQALLGGKKRADVVPRRSPKFELGRVARWARKRGYGAIMVVGEDHAKPSASLPPSLLLQAPSPGPASLTSLLLRSHAATMTMSLLPYGPTSHFRLSGITLCKDIPVRDLRSFPSRAHSSALISVSSPNHRAMPRPRLTLPSSSSTTLRPRSVSLSRRSSRSSSSPRATPRSSSARGSKAGRSSSRRTRATLSLSGGTATCLRSRVTGWARPRSRRTCRA